MLALAASLGIGFVVSRRGLMCIKEKPVVGLIVDYQLKWNKHNETTNNVKQSLRNEYNFVKTLRKFTIARLSIPKLGSVLIVIIIVIITRRPQRRSLRLPRRTWVLSALRSFLLREKLTSPERVMPFNSVCKAPGSQRTAERLVNKV